ncbi:MAG: septum formation protein Maf [Proteobacteria bacterium]|nr:septum formation protein Maf [Pseudomonadota bacterium]
MPQNYKVFLASQSPRRRELLGSLFNNINILDISFDEPKCLLKEKSTDFMWRCLEVKWQSASLFLPQSASGLLVVADTMVVLGGELLGKPETIKEAQKMLSMLSGKRHEVLTAFQWGLWNKKKLIKSQKRIVSSKVEFRKLKPKEIVQYIKTGEPMDKAGSYAFQGIGLKFIKETKGSYSNIIGFPLLEFKKSLRTAGLL